MRKGTTKPKKPTELPTGFTPPPLSNSMPVGNIVDLRIPPSQSVFEYDKTHASHLQETSYIQFKNILLRICDACHEMDNRTEPWATIRKDIERLK